MKKSEFLEKLQVAIKEARQIIARDFRCSTWQAAAQAGIKAGFKVNTNGLESEDKILLAIKGLMGRNLEDSMSFSQMILVEKAWEYYERKSLSEVEQRGFASQPSSSEVLEQGYGHAV